MESGRGDTILEEKQLNDKKEIVYPKIESIPSEGMSIGPKENQPASSVAKLSSKQMTAPNTQLKDTAVTKKQVGQTSSTRTMTKQLSILSPSTEHILMEAKPSPNKINETISLKEIKPPPPTSEYIITRDKNSLSATGKSLPRVSISHPRHRDLSPGSSRSRVSRQSIALDEFRSPRMSIMTTPDAEAMQTLLAPTQGPLRMLAQPGLKTSFAFGRRGERPSRIGQMLSTSLLSFQPSATGFERSKIPKHMNTYQLEAKQPFSVDRVNKLIQILLDKELENVKYEPTQCAKLSMTLSAELRFKVKEMGFDRYKLVCMVEIVEKKMQSLFSGMKLLWDEERDRYSTYSFHNSYIYAVATVYAIYYE